MIESNTCPYCGAAYTLAAGGCVVECMESQRAARLISEVAEVEIIESMESEVPHDNH